MNDNILLWVEKHIKLWSKPTTPVLISGLFTDLARSRTDRILENALLRQQLMVLDRQIKRPMVATWLIRQIFSDF